MRDSNDFMAVCDEPSIVTEDERSRARQTVASYVARTDGTMADATEFMEMLGILPGAESPERVLGVARLSRPVR